MDLGTALSVAQTLLTALQVNEVQEICSILGYKSQLEDLQRTVSTVKALLQNAEMMQDVSVEGHLWFQELKDAVYDADDLLDEFVTLVEQKKLIKDGKASKKVSLFFSRFNPVSIAYKMSHEVKMIRKKLDAIAKDHSQFGFRIQPVPIKKREETCSRVDESIIIGREDEKLKIVEALLDCNVERDVSFLTVVGIGGLGKTAFAQLIFNDPKIKTTFPLRLWTCVSDHDQNSLDVEGILRKILASSSDAKVEGPMERVQTQLCEKLTGTRFLLVLDDVWTENRNHWLRLVEFLMVGQKGSWIVVTTRSHETARIVGGLKHDLQGLSKDNSMRLFERLAFESQQLHQNDDDLVQMGREIVESCAGVPLAIRVAASLLYGQSKSTWRSFREIGLCNFKERQNDITSILKFSYLQLEAPLKSCFTYCALFPKDHVMEKELLIQLWMAQGYIVPFDKGQSIEVAAEEYFTILLSRCFFQDVVHNKLYGEIVSCKMHDLIHDLAQKVAGKEICFTNNIKDCEDKGIRHLALSRDNCGQYSFDKSNIRSFLVNDFDVMSLETLVGNWRCLRALDLSHCSSGCLHNSIGELVHLRYLNLSDNDKLEMLPKSITKLYNLQTLNLSWCDELKELPQDLSKLVKLRVLDISWCNSLVNMPRDMGKLTSLHKLSDFKISGSSRKQWFKQLNELKKLKSLEGSLDILITFSENVAEVTEDCKKEGSYLWDKDCVNQVGIEFKGRGDYEEAARLIEELQPHPNIRGLELLGYNLRMPCWGRGNNLVNSYSNLIDLRLERIMTEYLTCLGSLPHLKELLLMDLVDLEYMYEDSPTRIGSTLAGSSPNVEEFSLFPSVRMLSLWNLPKLKGWRKLRISPNIEDDFSQLHIDTTSTKMELLQLHQLNYLSVSYCSNLKVILDCPILERKDKLFLNECSEDLEIIMKNRETVHSK